MYVRIIDGKVKTGTKIKLMATNKVYDVTEVGVFTPRLLPIGELRAGDVGYITASIKNVRDARVGDTITEADRPTEKALQDINQLYQWFIQDIYPVDGAKYDELKEALEKLQINDAALDFEPETSIALGFGFRCGFLGLLHMEIIQERVEREFNLDIITTAPSVIYKVIKTNGEVIRNNKSNKSYQS